MKSVINVNDEWEICHVHRNFQAETEFIAWNKKTNHAPITAGRIRKHNFAINWEKPLTQEEIDWLITNCN